MKTQQRMTKQRLTKQRLTKQRLTKQRLASTSLSLLTLAVLPFAAACGSEKDGGGSQTVGTGTGTGAGSGTATLTGIHWTVADLTADGKKSEAPASAWLKIDKTGKVSGNLGCNGFGAQATVDDTGTGTATEVSFAQFLSTDMACESMDFENSLTKALKDGTLTAKATEDAKSTEQLTLTTKTGDTIHLTEEKAAPLYGTKWTITTLGATGEGDGDSQAVSPLPSGAEAYLLLDQAKGTVSGKVGCNNVSAEATVSDGNITFGSPSTTRRMCDGSLMEVEKSLLKIFDGKTAYKIDHRSMSLTSENGTTVSATAAD